MSPIPLFRKLLVVALTLLVGACRDDAASLTQPGLEPTASAPRFAVDITTGWAVSGAGPATITALSADSVRLAYGGSPYMYGTWHTWTFEQVATETTTLNLGWVYEGLHSWYMARAKMQIWAKDAAGNVQTLHALDNSVYDHFSFSGTQVVPVVAGQAWGVTVSGYHYDSSQIVQGEVRLTQLPPPTGSVEGQVTDYVTGAVIANATVRVDSTTLGTLTNEDGYYQITRVPPGAYTMSVSAVGYLPVTGVEQTVTAGEAAIHNFQLTPAYGTVVGVVTDSLNGQAVAGVQVFTVVSGDTVATLTDAAGAYTLRAVPAGTQTVTARKAGFQPQGARVAVPGGGTVTQSFALTPTSYDVTVQVVGSPCDATVTARNTQTTEFLLERADASCFATLQVTPGQAYVFAVHNEVISSAADHTVWPNTTPVPTASLPNRGGAVWVESGSGGSAMLLDPANWHAARSSATPITASRSLSLPFQPGVEVQCTLQNATYPAYVYAALPLNPGQVPPTTQSYPPAIGIYVDQVLSSSGDCSLQGMPEDEPVVVEARDADGDYYRGVIAPGETTITLEEDPSWFRVSYLVDPWGDALVDDVGFVGFGLEEATGPAAQSAVPSDVFVLKADVRSPQRRGEGKYEIEISGINGGAGSLKATVHCNKQTGACKLSQLLPGKDRSKVLGVDGELDPATGRGWFSIRLNFAGVNSADLRITAGNGNALDQAPDAGRVRWTRSDDPGKSWEVSF